jgi:signal-transduction protein with cAMP-binding, CBS, and nucleotidyltransferase domain
MSRKGTPVSEIMSSPVQTVTEDTTIAEAADVLTTEQIGSLVIGEDIICGIVTNTDIVRTVGADIDPMEAMVTEIMSDPVVTMRPHEAVHVAGERMGHNNVKRLPVTEDGQPVGIVTTTDLAYFFPKNRILMASDPEKDVHEGEFE